METLSNRLKNLNLKINRPIVCLLLAALLFTCSQQTDTKQYGVIKKEGGQLTIDGHGTEPTWNEAIELNDFKYPWRDEIAPNTSFRALWDEKNFYFLYQVTDDNIILKKDSTVDEEHEVVNSDRVEIFFRSKDTSKPYYALEMDALARRLDTKGKFSEKIDWAWDWPEEQITLRASINKDGYQIEGSINLSTLEMLGLLENKTIYAGLYRGEYVQSKGEKPEVRWISWIKPMSVTPNFHTPSSFGILRLND